MWQAKASFGRPLQDPVTHGFLARSGRTDGVAARTAWQWDRCGNTAGVTRSWQGTVVGKAAESAWQCRLHGSRAGMATRPAQHTAGKMVGKAAGSAWWQGRHGSANCMAAGWRGNMAGATCGRRGTVIGKEAGLA
jgi:hypothetical protein